MPKEIHEIIDHQIRRWEIEAAARRRASAQLAQATPVVRPVITIGRLLGAGGEEIARRIGEKLGYEVCDQQILEVMTREGNYHTQMLQALDERDQSYLELFVDGLLHGEIVDKSEYLKQLIRVLGSISVHGRAIIVGRGAGLILGADRTLRVRVVAPFDARAEKIASTQGLTPENARIVVRESDRERAAFMQHYFHRRIDDPVDYDLIVNTEQLTVMDVVDLIVAAFHKRFEGKENVEI